MDISLNDIDLESIQIPDQEEEETPIPGAVINFHNITHDDMNNGPGLRVVLWVAGCSHHCKECHNPVTWDPNGGIPLDAWNESEFWEWLDKPWTKGATFSGGDPLHCANRGYIGKMAQKIKETRINKDVVVYTGYTLKADNGDFYFEDKEGNTFSYPALKYIDILNDGPFDCDIRKGDIASDRFVPWVGSSNQRVIDVQESLKAGKVVERKYDKSGKYTLV